jgi:NADPH:quinone reductase-like Zn-dependent oxidoreductase
MLILPQGGSGPSTPDIIPSSDGAGIVLATGSSVIAFKAGDKVVTHLAPFIPENQWPSFANITAGMGQQVNGTLTQFGVFPQSGLVHAPKNANMPQAATLTCSALTAWNSLFGLKGREPVKGDWILTQGTGGVSIAALQVSAIYFTGCITTDNSIKFAVAAGANVLATTSSNEKAKRLRELGAKHVINYRQTPDWGITAKYLTPNKQGVDIVVDVGGDNTLAESVKAVRQDGLVIAAGLVAGTVKDDRPSLLNALWNLCIVRGVLLGTRNQFKEMNSFVEKHKIEMAVDDEVFELKDANKAYERLEGQKHFAKVIIKIK